MLCEHLRAIEAAVLASGANETFRGQAWSDNCREWVYVDVVLDLADLRRRFAVDPCVVDHENDDPRSGTECGLVCTIHHDGLLGLRP